MKNIQHQEAAFCAVMAHRTLIHACVKAIVHEPELTEDTFSDVMLEIVRSWEDYDQSRPFPPWACGVARHVALANLRREHRQPQVLDQAFLEEFAEDLNAIGNESHLDQRKEALRLCMAKLSGPNQRLIHLRYFEDQSYGEMSHLVKKTVRALHIGLSRIRQALSQCVDRESRSL
jgi:RNA polymerase sigma-70 factor, ECF subfamily